VVTHTSSLMPLSCLISIHPWIHVELQISSKNIKCLSSALIWMGSIYQVRSAIEIWESHTASRPWRVPVWSGIPTKSSSIPWNVLKWEYPPLVARTVDKHWIRQSSYGVGSVVLLKWLLKNYKIMSYKHAVFDVSTLPHIYLW